MPEKRIPTPKIDPDEGMERSDEDRENNALVLNIARMLHGRNGLEIDCILREVRKLTGIAMELDTQAAPFRQQEAIFELHFGDGQGPKN